MELQLINISSAYESETNPRDKKDFEGPAFDDLVASIKEKGVIVPVLARRRKKDAKEFEIIVGSRRLKAARVAGLLDIPAKIVEMGDVEAREVQIIENLQRKDVHPLDEGFGYRQLIEKSDYDVENLAIKVGKPQGYIRQRLFLTNLTERPANAYRKGEIADGHAVLVARLSPLDQSNAMRYLRDSFSLPSVKQFKEWIEEEFYHPLAFQPWLKDKEANKAVGKCIECSPNLNTLFGEVKEGSCTDLKCWKRKMGRYILHQIAKSRKQGVELLKVSKEYGSAGPEILSANAYTSVSFKKKDRCKYAQKAIVAAGSDLGTFLWVCISSECPKHQVDHGDYTPTPKEKERRRKEIKEQKTKREKEEKRIVESLEKVKWPLTGKNLDIIFEIVLNEQGTTVLRPVAKRFKISPKKKTRCGSTYYDWEDSIREASEGMDNAEKLRFIIGILLERTWGDLKNKILKMF